MDTFSLRPHAPLPRPHKPQICYFSDKILLYFCVWSFYLMVGVFFWWIPNSFLKKRDSESWFVTYWGLNESHVCSISIRWLAVKWHNDYLRLFAIAKCGLDAVGKRNTEKEDRKHQKTWLNICLGRNVPAQILKDLSWTKECRKNLHF